MNLLPSNKCLETHDNTARQPRWLERRRCLPLMRLAASDEHSIPTKSASMLHRILISTKTKAPALTRLLPRVNYGVREVHVEFTAECIQSTSTTFTDTLLVVKKYIGCCLLIHRNPTRTSENDLLIL